MPHRPYRFLLALLVLPWPAFSQKPPRADAGTLDARSWDFSDAKIPLNGYWTFHYQQLVPPEKCGERATLVTLFPELWNDIRDSKGGVGFATYCLRILLPEEMRGVALAIPQVYSSYRLWANGVMVAENGVVAKTKAEATPQWLPQTVSFQTETDTLFLVLQIANFHHHKGGIKDPIYLGESTGLRREHSVMMSFTLAEGVMLFLLGILFLLVYFFKGRKKIVFYFFLLCMAWSIRSVFSNSYLIIAYFPDLNWEMMVKVEYFTLYLAMVSGILFLSALFPRESSKHMKYLITGGNAIFIIFTLFTPAIEYTRWLPAYLSFSAILIVYAIVVIVVAFINDRHGVMSVVGAILLGLVIFGYDLVAYEGLVRYDGIVLSLGYTLIFFLLGTAVLFHLHILKSTSQSDVMLTLDDFYKNQ